MNCFYCGATADAKLKTKDYLSPTFNAGRIVASPDSEVLCQSCVWFLQEKATINVAQTETRTAQKVRSYSWVITAETRIAYTKAHLKELQAICLQPPVPPFLILLADSGQKHLFYRSAFNLSSDVFTVQLEEETIVVSPPRLATLLALTTEIAALAGKGFLQRPPASALAIKLFSVIPESPTRAEDLFTRWQTVYSTPLARLAAWLTVVEKKES